MATGKAIAAAGVVALAGVMTTPGRGADESGPLALLKERGLSSAGRYFIVASEGPFRQKVQNTRPVMNDMAGRFNKWAAIIRNEQEWQELTDAIPFMESDVNTLRVNLANMPMRDAREKLEAAAVQNQLNVAVANLNYTRNQVVIRQKRMVPGDKERAEAEFTKVREKFLGAVDELQPLFDQVKKDYGELAENSQVKNAIDAHSRSMKGNFKLGPSDKLLKEAAEVKTYERNFSPETAPRKTKSKRPTYKGMRK